MYDNSIMERVGSAESYMSTGDAELNRQLHVCSNEECGGELVYPADWKEEGYHKWRIWLRCPECEHREELVSEIEQVERLVDELDRASSAVLGELRRMTYTNRSGEIDFFISVLDADIITPDDF
jgi:hypothetical protein